MTATAWREAWIQAMRRRPKSSGIQADEARANGVEAHGPFEQWASERGIMDEGLGEQKADGQAGAATEQGMHAIAT